MFYRKVNDQTLKNRCLIFGLLTIFVLVNTGVNFSIDFLVNNGLTWSLYPVYSVIFGWLLFLPFTFKHERLEMWLCMPSSLILPYLFLMDRVYDGTTWFWFIAFPVSIGAILFIWLCYACFVMYGMKRRKGAEGHVN